MSDKVILHVKESNYFATMENLYFVQFLKKK
jgi:hypothetical protein